MYIVANKASKSCVSMRQMLSRCPCRVLHGQSNASLKPNSASRHECVLSTAVNFGVEKSEVDVSHSLLVFEKEDAKKRRGRHAVIAD